ncbi:phage terminase large subunit [Amedibacterium intestinale]|jgi:phage terminase large subunit-like protein|uniref:Phage terminase large subunit n=2 Tax=Amedibacterium intestinale TaxID=2583452 RepID=A0A6N4TPE2_9FIRM|nr:phage terminase large subunit [Amedibacterium intestinale]DAQ11573.1 MAG TPA: Large Terminase [Caudoviricetes sp.]
MKTYLEQYWDLITSGQVIVGQWLRMEMQNLINDLNDDRYIYDTTEAHKRIRFQESLCLQSKAPFYMKPVVLMPWQKAWWEAIYSFKMADTKQRRFIEGLLEIARKNGKSTMFAADGNTDLFIGQGGVSICTASNDDRQAKFIWSEIGGMRSRLDPKKTITSQNLVEIRNNLKNIDIIRLSSKTQNMDGFNFIKVYLDESHDMADDEIAEACWRAMSTHDEPLFLNCSTNGFIVDGYLDKKLDYAKKVILGEIDDIHFLPFLYEQDSEQEIWTDEASWEKSNPSIRYGVKKIAKLRRDIEVAKVDKSSRMHLLTKDFNIKQNNAQAWLTLEDYDYPVEVYSLEDFRGAYCLGAVDLSATTDLSNAKILLMKQDDKTKYVYSHYWIPESKLESSDDKAAGAKYLEWAKQGILTIHDGNEIDVSQIADWFYQLYANYEIKLYKCGYDQRYAKTFLDKMDFYNFECEMIYQNRNVMSSPMKLVEADLKARYINYNRNEMDMWCLGNASMEMDNLGNVMCVKIDNQKSRRIDGAVTLIILYEVFRRYRNDFMLMVR